MKIAWKLVHRCRKTVGLALQHLMLAWVTFLVPVTNAQASDVSIDRHSVMQIAQGVAKRLQPLLKDSIHVVNVFRKETSPLLSIPATQNMCIVVLNKNPDGWSLWERFLSGLESEKQLAMIELAVAHEIGHCVHAQEATVGLSLGIAPATQSPGIEPGWSETFADLFAGAYAHLYMGDSAEDPIRKLIKVRGRLSWLERKHDTGSALEQFWSSVKIRKDGESDWQTPLDIMHAMGHPAKD